VSEDGDLVTVDETHEAYPRAVDGVASPRPLAKKIAAATAPVRGNDTLSWAQKAKNFAVASSQHVAAGMPMCSEDEIIRRHDICLGCEFFKENSCIKCGCPVVRDKKFISKLAWADQSCPIGKWGAVT
jgi:hypothetical protein